MRQTIAILMVLAACGIPAAHAQNPPILTPPPPVVVPPLPVAPAPVPSANPMPAPLSPGYGTPPGINTATPLGSTPRAVYRQPAGPGPGNRHHKKRRFQSSSR